MCANVLNFYCDFFTDTSIIINYLTYHKVIPSATKSKEEFLTDTIGYCSFNSVI